MIIFQENRGSNSYVEVSNITMPENYELNMLTHCSLKLIPRTEVREIDGEKSLLFKVDGLISLESRCKRVYPDKRFLNKMLSDMKACFMELKDYMLSPENVILDMKYIFYSEEKDEYRFLYVPGKTKSFREEIKDLFEDFMRVYDHKDSEGVMYLYDMYSHFLSESFTSEMFCKMLEQDTAEEQGFRSREKTVNEKTAYEIETIKPEEKEPVIYEDVTEINKSIYILAAVGAFVMTIIMLLVFGKGTLKISVLVIMAVAVYIVVDYMHKKNELETASSMMGYLKREDPFPVKKKVLYEGSLRDGKNAVSTDDNISISNDSMKNASLRNDTSDTTVLGSGVSDNVSRLVPKSGGTEYKQILLIEGETKVGRQDSTCDYVLDDPSVSRLHAVLDKQGDVVTLTDMGSTNGTYINDDRLPEGEVRVLTPGDLISIANISYECL